MNFNWIIQVELLLAFCGIGGMILLKFQVDFVDKKMGYGRDILSVNTTSDHKLKFNESIDQQPQNGRSTTNRTNQIIREEAQAR